MGRKEGSAVARTVLSFVLYAVLGFSSSHLWQIILFTTSSDQFRCLQKWQFQKFTDTIRANGLAGMFYHIFNISCDKTVLGSNSLTQFLALVSFNENYKK